MEYIPESVEERQEEDRGKKHYDVFGVIEFYVEKPKPVLGESMQLNNTPSAIQRDISQGHKIMQYYAEAIRTLVRKGKERVKEHDHLTILRAAGSEKKCLIVGGLILAVVKYFSEAKQRESSDWTYVYRAPLSRYFFWWIPW